MAAVSPSCHLPWRAPTWTSPDYASDVTPRRRLLLGPSICRCASGRQPAHPRVLPRQRPEGDRARGSSCAGGGFPALVQGWLQLRDSRPDRPVTPLEHDVQGSRKLDAGEASRILRELGAEENAFTSDDYTAYYQVLARDRLAVAFELEADRLASLRLPPEEFAREIEVIRKNAACAPTTSPARWPTSASRPSPIPPAATATRPSAGWTTSIACRPTSCVPEYEQWYAPNNATLVVVGDVTADEVRGLAERFFGGIERREVPTAKQPLELDEPGERRLQTAREDAVADIADGVQRPSLATGERPPGARAAVDLRPARRWLQRTSAGAAGTRRGW